MAWSKLGLPDQELIQRDKNLFHNVEHDDLGPFDIMHTENGILPSMFLGANAPG